MPRWPVLSPEEYLNRLKVRFWSKVKKTNKCWIWQAATFSKGYGQFEFKVNGKKRPVLAHRMAWELVYGFDSIPIGMQVCHNCPGGDNDLCVNPAHLFLGTQLENIQDRDKKGRTATGNRSGRRLHPESFYGERNSSAKLTIKKVRWIRRSYTGKRGELTKFAVTLDVTVPLIRAIIQRKIWRHVS